MDPASTSKRSYDNSLRLKQREATRLSILEAAQELVLTGRLHNFTMQEVAAGAGVSQRTVYVHFPSREAVLEGLVEWGLEQAAPPPYPNSLDDLPTWLEQAVPPLLSYLPTAKAIHTVTEAVYEKEPPPRARERDQLFTRLVRDAAPSLGEVERRAFTAGLRLLVSMRSWIELRYRYGLEDDALVLAVVQSVRAQIALLKERAAAAGKGEEK